MKFLHNKPKQLQEISSTEINGKRFYTLPNGAKVPSVTTVVGAMKAEKIQEWRNAVGEKEANRITKEASSRGTNMHTICENYLNNNINFRRNSMPDALEMFYSIREYVNKINNIHYLEAPLYSEKIQLAGRCDVIAEYDGTLSIIDFKTSRKTKAKEDILDYFWQTAAYATMYEDLVGEPINQLVIIMAVKDDSPLIFVEKTEDHIDGLIDCIKFYRNKNKNNYKT